MSGGKRIDDHRFFAGGMSKDSVLPKGVHVKNYSSAEGAGHEGTYEDTTEAIKASQEKADKKIKGHARDPMFRN